ncbi:DeoR/GlpR family DNA-binding transcription regulator [Xylanimonas allomyrinae]|nr:DeoR/GlpR family DNA-binding transcription regulator [Xylanimonas allomyrinae]
MSQRRLRIAEMIARRGEVSIGEIIESVGVSAMTVHRDLAKLEDVGLIERRHGRVSALATTQQEAAASLRIEQRKAAKRAIARLVAQEVSPGSSVIFDDSTSGLWVLRAMADVLPLSVITHSQRIAQEASARSGVQLFVAGGAYLPWADSFVGPTTAKILSGLRANYAVMSSSGILRGSCYHPIEELAQLKRVMLRSADTSILVVDHTKFTRQAGHAFAALTEFDLVVTDSATPAAAIAAMRDSGVHVRVAGAGTGSGG